MMGSHVGGHAAIHGPLLMGIVYGLIHIISPDHLGTLMTLSSVTSPGRAFRVGAAWGLGHSFGMVFIAFVFLGLRSLVTVDMHKWEHYGNYFIGASMIAIALYFILSESSFLKEEADGSVTAKGCACHGSPDAEVPPERHFAHSSRGHYGASSDEALACQPCCPPGDDCCKESPAGSKLFGALADREAPGPKQTWWQRAWAERDLKGALLGVCQGMCCPLGMLGVGFLAGLDAGGVVAFLIVFIGVATFGTAVVAVVWAALTAYGLGAKVSSSAVYRGSCACTLALGLAWIVANFFGILGALDYTERLHAH